MDENVSRPECGMRKLSGGFVHAVDVVIEGKGLRAKVVDDEGTTRDLFTVALP